MKLTFKAAEDRYNRLTNWHSWFAWHPVRVATDDVRWLERVERKGELLEGVGQRFWDWSFRALNH